MRKVKAALCLKAADETAGEISQVTLRIMAQAPVRGTTRQVTAPQIGRLQTSGCLGEDIKNVYCL